MEMHRIPWEEMRKALSFELEYVRDNKGRGYRLSNGKKKGREGKGWIYEFNLDEESVTQWLENAKGTLRVGYLEFEATVINLEPSSSALTLFLKDDLGEEVEQAIFEVDLSYLYEKMIERIELIEAKPYHFRLDTAELLLNPRKEIVGEAGDIKLAEKLNSFQSSAIESSLRNKICFIWGPPGTGKTRTLGILALNLVERGERILIASHANRAADNALIAVVEAMKDRGYDELRIQRLITRYRFAMLDDAKPYALEEQKTRRLSEGQAAECPTFPADMLAAIHALAAIHYLIRERLQILPDVARHLERIGDELEGIFRRIYGSSEDERNDIQGEQGIEVNLSEKKIIVTTLTTIAVDSWFAEERFNTLIVDEGSMAPLPLLFIAASIADRVVIIGDPYQLPPIAVSDEDLEKRGLRDKAELVRKWLRRDIFTLASKADSLEDLMKWQGENGDFVKFLSIQYRMPPVLCELVSRYFYNGKIKSKYEGKEGECIVIVDTWKLSPTCEQDERYSRFNRKHAEKVIEIIEELLGEGFEEEQIGVITPYRAQSSLIRRCLKDIGVDVEVGTIHTFQGRQKEVILFDLTDADPLGPGKLLDEGKSGDDAKRLLNVAFSRASSKLILLLSTYYVRRKYTGKILGEIIREIIEGTESPFPRILVTELKTLKHEGGVAALTFSHNGRLLASGGLDGRVKIWETESWEPIDELSHGDKLASIAFSHDGSLFVSAGERGAKIWEASSWKKIKSFEGRCSSVAFSPDDSLLAIGYGDGIVRVLRTSDWSVFSELKEGEDSVKIAFSPDGSLFALGAGSLDNRGVRYKCVKIRQTKDWDLIKEIRREGWFGAIFPAFSPDGFLFAFCDDRVVKVCRTSDWDTWTLGKHDSVITSITFSPNSSLLVSGSSKTIKIWKVSLKGCQLLKTLQIEDDNVTIIFSPRSDLFASGSYNGNIRIWRVEEEQYGL